MDEKIKNYAIAIFYIVLASGSIIFVVNYGLTDWEEVSDDLASSIEAVSCEIDYGDFHFKGMCTDKDTIFTFLRNGSMNRASISDFPRPQEIHNVGNKDELSCYRTDKINSFLDKSIRGEMR